MIPDFFVALEGQNGCGKTSVAKRLLELSQKDEEWRTDLQLAEPAEGYLFYDQIQDYLTGNRMFSKETLTYLFAANRKTLRRDLLEWAGLSLVIMDRSLVSSMVYQSGKRYSMKDIAEINSDCLPNLLLLLQCPYSVRMRRLNQRTDYERTVLDLEDDNWKRYLKAGYILQKYHGVPMEVVHADTPLEEISLYCSLLIQRYRTE